MTWNWEQLAWPDFKYAPKALEPLEKQFLVDSGEFVGAYKHIGPNDRNALKIELISDEAIKTSEIEGELLNRDSVQSSLRKQFGLGQDASKATPTELGIAEMMANLYETFAAALTHQTLFGWHKMLMKGARNIQAVGDYRTHTDPMQIVSNVLHEPKVHFEAPPSDRVKPEMDKFVAFFNDTAPAGKRPLPSLARAGLVHLYFESIHPFEDGNGRIGRALAEKALAQNLGQPSLIALAYTIERARKTYYQALERNSRDTEVTDWLVYFAETILAAQRNTIKRVDFYVAKTKLYDRLRGQLNERQEKVIARLFKEGIDGFKGGLSAENYISIAKTSRATATRDLQDLVTKGALTKTGELRHTRYWLDIPR
jgi:Fic family protein